MIAQSPTLHFLRPNCALILTTLLTSSGLSAQKLKTELVADGFSYPVYLCAPDGDQQRLFVVEQFSGQVRIIQNGQVLADPYLSIEGRNGLIGERGLLGMTFHPDYANNGYSYIYFTNTDGNSVLERYTVSATDPNQVDPASLFEIFNYPQPAENHNGGMIDFSPIDGYLYIGFGDGGHLTGGELSQNPVSMLGKMLRIDVDGGSPYVVPPDNPFLAETGDPLGRIKDEIWAFGLRNPWRWSFDRYNGDLYIADVGASAWEEINIQPASSLGGKNYGWPNLEGTECHAPETGCDTVGMTSPEFQYGHGGNPYRCSITGGFVYRGSQIPGMFGHYFFSDWCSSEIRSIRKHRGMINLDEFLNHTQDLTPSGGRDLLNISSFGEDGVGELYVLDREDGEVFKIMPDLLILQTDPWYAGQMVQVRASGMQPGDKTRFYYSVRGPGVYKLTNPQQFLGLSYPSFAGAVEADSFGVAVMDVNLPLGSAGRSVWFQAASPTNTSNLKRQIIK